MSGKCECPPCSACRGRGNVPSRLMLDEFVDLEQCDECGGSGFEFMCDYCHDARERDEDLNSAGSPQEQETDQS